MGRSVAWLGVVQEQDGEEELDVSTDASRCCNNCCPEAPAITISQTVIESDGLPNRTRQERGGVAWTVGASGPHITLLATPISDASVQVHISGDLQRQGVDYTIDGDEITLAQALPADTPQGDVIVTYISEEAAS